jgi:protein phosphatase
VNWEEPIDAAGLSDTGMRRLNNQDSFAVVAATSPEKWRQRGHVYMVADGMGAHAVGELASKMACENIPHNYAKVRDLSPEEAIVRAYREVGTLIHGKATANRDFHGMGTTCSTLVLLPAGAMIAHVGDSRIYRVRGERIEQLTFDHSLVWELVRQKHLTSDQASKAIPRNVITRSLGPDPMVEVDVRGPYPVRPGDAYLICSDGLSGPIGDPELGAIVRSFRPDQACPYLIHLANLRGGMDNITAVIVRVGPWVEPGDSGECGLMPGDTPGPKRSGFRLGNLFGSFQRRTARSEPITEEIHRAADCPVDEPLLNRLSDEIRQTQAMAIDQGWKMEEGWSTLASLRRKAEEERAAGKTRKALQCLCEAVVLLGQAGRLHRKERGPNGHH